MVHVNIGPRFTKLEMPRRPSMLDIAAGATKLGLTSKAIDLGGQALRFGARGAARNPSLSARALSWAARGTPRWPWETGPRWSMPWQRRSAPAWATGPRWSMPWQRRSAPGWATGPRWSMPWQRRSAPGWMRIPAMSGLAAARLAARPKSAPRLAWPRLSSAGAALASSVPSMLPRRQRPQPMPWLKRRWALLAGIALGAVMAYFLDVEQGNRRRKMAVQRGARVVRQTLRAAGSAGRKMSSDLVGKRQALLHSRDHHEELDDATLAHKVETILFRDPSVPKGELNVNAEHGVVVIRGEVHDPVQMARIEQMVRRIDGVHEVHSLLHTADSPAPNKAAF